MVRILSLAMMVTISALALTATASPISLVNGDFEYMPAHAPITAPYDSVHYSVYTVTGTEGGYYWSTVPGWTNTGDNGAQTLVGARSTYSADVKAAHGSAMYISNWFDSAWVSQTTSATFEAGKTYTFSIDVGNAPGYNRFYANDATADIAFMTADGGTLQSLAVDNTNIGTFQTFSVSYTATADDAGKPVIVGFRKTSDTAHWWLDAIDFDNAAVDVTAVPEPATLSLIVLGGLAMLKRRK